MTGLITTIILAATAVTLHLVGLCLCQPWSGVCIHVSIAAGFAVVPVAAVTIWQELRR